MPKFGKRTPFTRSHFAEFETLYGKKSDGSSSRKDQGEASRWRVFSREWILERNDSLYISWLKDENTEDVADLPEPEVLAHEVILGLTAALDELNMLLLELGETEVAA